MRFWMSARVEQRRLRTRSPAVEALEGRALLSTVVSATTTVSTAIPISDVPTDVPLTAANASDIFPIATAAASAHPVLAARRNALASRQAARIDAARSISQNTSTPADAAGATGALAVKTAWNGYWLTHSRDVANVGYRYAKTTFSHDSRKLAGSYVKAAIRGDGKALNNLGHTPLVKKISNDFSQLTASKPVQTVGTKFHDFGKSVTDQYHKIFG